jgi:tRNA A-37 threonylcarbamoyl transferase component Bud32
MNSLSGSMFGRYYLLEQVALGGMATVYKGLDLDRDEKVAIKVMSPHLAQTPQFRARFAREIRLLRALSHPNIVPILNFGEDHGLAFIVMPFFSNGTLQNRMQRGPLTPREGARLMDQLSAALDHAHQMGIVHRDVKPSNVLLDAEGNAMLSDFGFAQVQDASLTLTGGALIGTPAYMSPEQCKGDPVDARSDQYSLGVILYQMTTGRLPFDADTPMGLVVKHVNMPLTPPRLISPNIPEGVEAVLIKAMAKEPIHRFASVAEMNKAFQESLAAALDASGRLKPQPVTVEPTTKQLTRPLPVVIQTTRTPWYRRRAVLLAGVFLLFACPATAYALVGKGGFGAGAVGMPPLATATATPVDLVGTIFALSTDIARADGTPLSEGQVATAVAGTIMAAGVAGGSGESAPPPILTVTATPQPSETLRAAGTQRATATQHQTSAGGSNPTATPTPTTSSTPTDTSVASAAPSPTQTSVPTTPLSPTQTTVPTTPPTPTRTPLPPPPPTHTHAPTRTPVPTDTPRPTHTPKCDDHHPCTPTPSATDTPMPGLTPTA